MHAPYDHTAETVKTRVSDDMKSGRVILAVLAFWTFSACFSLGWNILQDYHQMQDIAIAEARSHLKKDMAFRLWISYHGGIYAPVSDHTVPDPDLQFLPDRDVETADGTRLTLIHPVSGARQINAYFSAPFDITSRTVSLHPQYPGDEPDAWESESLHAFDAGQTEASEFTEMDGQPVLRYLQPAYAEEHCLKCHAREGFKAGDILGAVGIRVPLAPRLILMHQHMYKEIAAHGGLWLVGLFGIRFGSRRFRVWLRFRRKAEGQLREREALFRGLSEQSPNMIFISLYGTVVYANEKFAEVMGCQPEDLSMLRVDIRQLLSEGSRGPVSEYFKRQLSGPETAPLECTLVTARGEAIEGIMAATPIQFKGRKAILGTITDITNRKEMEASISASLREKEVLLQEVHHRVKNNLQVISSLLSLQAHTVSNPAVLEVFKESERRIRSMAAVHEQLYRSGNLSSIDAAAYIHSVVEDVYGSYNSNVHIELQTELESIPLAPDKAIPCGLIINELMSNALKYGFPEGQVGKVTVKLQRNGAADSSGDECSLTVCDNGVGLPPELDVRKTESLGLQLVTSLCERQLRGTLEVDRNGGTCFKLRFSAR